MPETRLERLVAALGLVAIAFLVAVIVQDWPGKASTSKGPTTASSSVSATTTVSPVTATSSSTTVQKSPSATLSITAARGDAWFEVRARSATGAVLYTGILPKGETKSFAADPLWVRFGAASNIDARVDGRLVPLSAGTYDARFAQGTLRRIGG